ncbi:snRNA-activating protein of 50kDa MW C terminal-domain-containing protein [Fennellomyces sp. T-0311]|nr:snRNA-activating protein of 50kDa MW C terminal-domain-containing protein [Fennellomyces sp. T-0311]
MSKINVGEFKRSHAELMQEQALEQDSIDFEALKTKIDPALLEKHECLSNASEFFTDPTLFELLKRYKETEILTWTRQRIRTEQDQIVTKKPQAKDVFPNRTLLEEDEKLLQEMEQQGDLGTNRYINPIVPKRRKYVAEMNAPGVLQELYTPSTPSTPTTPQTIFEQTKVQNRSLASAFPDPESANRVASILHPELALPGLENVDEDDENEAYQSAAESVATEGTSGDIMNPAIPKTHLTRVYADMVEKVKNSPLHSVSNASVLDLTPRQRAPRNYVLFNKEVAVKTLKKDKPKRKRGKKRSRTENASEDNAEESDVERNTDEDSTNGMDGDAEDSIKDEEISGEVILKIAVYHHTVADRRVREFDILGSQKMTDLRDAIFCMKDFSLNRDRKGKNPDGELLNTVTKKMSGSFLFIEDVFYVDTRAEEAGLGPEPDYSKSIRDWVMENGRYKQDNLANYTQQPMQNVAFEDLELRLNHPYLFLHQEDCQHVIMVRDIRMQCRKDLSKRSEYPCTTYNWQFMRYKCNMCAIYPAEYVTVVNFQTQFNAFPI